MTVTRGLPLFHETVRPEWIDYNGHMSEAFYVLVFGFATDTLMERTGMDSGYRESTRCSLYTVESHIRYLSEVHVGKHVAIRTRALGRTAKRIHFMHFMTIEETGALAAVQEHVAAHIDMTVRRMVALPPEIAERFDRLVEEHGRLGWDAPVCGAMRP